MRKQISTLALSSAVLIAGLVLGAPAEAADRTTHLTLEHPVRVPGATLPAGHYVFTLNPNHAVVWIRNEDDSHVYGPYFTRPLRRLKSTSQRKIVVERSADVNGIPTLRGWFGRHRERGHEFVYPRPTPGLVHCSSTGPASVTCWVS